MEMTSIKDRTKLIVAFRNLEKSYQLLKHVLNVDVAVLQDRHSVVNLLVPELFFLILAHPVYKMWIIQEQNTLKLWNKLHFEEKKTESIYHV